MTASVASVASRATGRWARPDPVAVRDILPVVLSVMPFAAVIGVTIAQAGRVPDWAGLLAGPLMYGGSAQLAAVSLLDAGAGLATVLSTVVVVNARLTMYGAGIEPRFRRQPWWFRWLGPHFLVDQTFAVALPRDDLDDPARFRRYWLTAGLVLGVGWTATMGAALLLGPAVPAGSALDVAAPALFVGLLVPMLRRPRARRAALVAAVVAVVAAPLPNGGGLLAGAVAGVVPALLRRSPS